MPSRSIYSTPATGPGRLTSLSGRLNTDASVGRNSSLSTLVAEFRGSKLEVLWPSCIREHTHKEGRAERWEETRVLATPSDTT